MLDSISQSKPLTELERQFILLSQQGLPLVEKPYAELAKQLSISEQQCLALAEKLQQQGIIRRIAVVPNHYKLGYCFNGMTVWNIADEYAQQAGQQIGQLPFVSHCYLRPRQLPLWPYNLFAMIHGKTQQQINQYRTEIKQLLEKVVHNKPIDNDMLVSSQILKKTGLRLRNKDS